MNKDLKEKFAFTLGATHVGIFHNIGGTFHKFVESFTHVGISHITRRVAFTLAEVLITLGIIGVVSAMTIPTLVRKYQDIVFTAKFKQAYAMLNEAIRLASIDFGPNPPKCGYWGGGNPYTQQGYSSLNKYDENGNYIKTVLVKDGEEIPLPADLNGPIKDCNVFGTLILNRLKVVKECKGNALRDGCVAKGGYEGFDTIAKDKNPNLSDEEIKKTPGIGTFLKKDLDENNQIVLLKNNISVISCGNKFDTQTFAIDVNGPQGPNKWGYDLFDLRIKYENNNLNLPVLYGPLNWVSKGGVSTTTMINRIKKNKTH